MTDKEFLKQTGTRIRQCREEKVLTQNELAGAIGVPLQSVQLLEAGEFNATISDMAAIAKALQLPVQALFLHE